METTVNWLSEWWVVKWSASGLSSVFSIEKCLECSLVHKVSAAVKTLNIAFHARSTTPFKEDLFCFWGCNSGEGYSLIIYSLIWDSSVTPEVHDRKKKCKNEKHINSHNYIIVIPSRYIFKLNYTDTNLLCWRPPGSSSKGPLRVPGP